MPIYNLPGVNEALNFTPQALADMYLGKITKWNDPEIAKPNPNVSLPANDIEVVHRQDGSGTTYVWTDYLTKVSSDWQQRVGRGISVIWPVGVAAKGNEGVVRMVARTPYSIGYSELTYAVRKRLTYGTVANHSGQFIQANLVSVTAAAADVANNMPEDFRVSITDTPGQDAYPISSFTWMLIPSVIADSAKRSALIAFLRWGLSTGQGYLEPLSYARLPDSVIAKEEKAIDRIKLAGRSEAAQKRPKGIAERSVSETQRGGSGLIDA